MNEKYYVFCVVLFIDQKNMKMNLCNSVIKDKDVYAISNVILVCQFFYLSLYFKLT